MPITRAIPDHELRAWADRMHDALTTIAEAMESEETHEDARMGPADVERIARRALNPDEWERTG